MACRGIAFRRVKNHVYIVFVCLVDSQWRFLLANTLNLLGVISHNKDYGWFDAILEA